MIDWMVGRSTSCGNDACRNLWRVLVYLALNLWTVLPGLVAIVILVVLRQSAFLAEGCQCVGSFGSNPVFCQNTSFIDTTFAASAQEIRRALVPPALTESAQIAARDAAGIADRATRLKAIADAAVDEAKAIVEAAKTSTDAAPAARQGAPPHAAYPASRTPTPTGGSGPPVLKPGAAAVPGAGLLAAQQLLAQRTNEQAEAGLHKAEADFHQLVEASNALSQFRAQATIFREAKARLRWIASYAAVVAFALGAIIGSIWVFATAVDDHINPEPPPDASIKQKLVIFTCLCVLLCLSAGFLAEAWVGFYRGGSANLFGTLSSLGPFDEQLLSFDDAITTFIFGNEDGKMGNLLPSGLPLLKRANLLILFAIGALALAVSATLYQRPFQVLPLRRPAPPPLPAVDGKPPKLLPQTAYDRLLIRSFQRLNTCIYLGATLLVICVVNVSERYSWVASLLDPNAVDEPWKSSLPNAINGVAEELALQYGLGFSTLLLALLLPTWVILRRRAWVVARLCNPCSTDIKTLQTWLSDNGMGFTSLQKYAQLLAVLAPAGAGIFVSALKALTGAAS